MKEALKFLQDYAKASDNLWLYNSLELLEKEIEIEILKQKISFLDKVSEEQNSILNKPS